MSSECKFIFWDVQHGHACYIKTPNNRHIVIDLGTGDYSSQDEEFSPLQYLRKNMGVSQLDYLIITHPHLDHIDDILSLEALSPKVLNRPKHLSREEIMSGVQTKDKDKFEVYCELDGRYNREISSDSYDNTTNPNNWGGLEIQGFTPKTCAHTNFNNHSIITVFTFAGLKVVIPGDNEKCSFDELLLKPDFKSAIRDADVLLAPHHGRESGYYSEFIDLVDPRLTIVSDGRFCDTSANSRYSAKSSGWKVHHRSGKASTTRKCITTNSDGHIEVNIGENTSKPFLSVTID